MITVLVHKEDSKKRLANNGSIGYNVLDKEENNNIMFKTTYIKEFIQNIKVFSLDHPYQD